MRFADEILKIKFTLNGIVGTSGYVIYFDAFINNYEENLKLNTEENKETAQQIGAMYYKYLPTGRSISLSFNVIAQDREEAWLNYKKVVSFRNWAVEVPTRKASGAGGTLTALTDSNYTPGTSNILFAPLTGPEELSFRLTSYNFKPIEDFGHVIYTVGSQETLIAKAYMITVMGEVPPLSRSIPLDRGIASRSNIIGDQGLRSVEGTLGTTGTDTAGLTATETKTALETSQKEAAAYEARVRRLVEQVKSLKEVPVQ
jgi:hypothetical protein